MSEQATPPALPHERLFVGRHDVMWGNGRPGVSRPDLPAGWADTAPHPWRRYFARLLDTAISGVFAEIAVLWALLAINPELGGRIAHAVATSNPVIQTPLIVALAVIPNAVIIGLSGCSIGKWIFGVRVLKPDGRPIGVLKGLGRELRVTVMGLAFGIPLLSFITMIASMTGLRETGVTGWDRSMKLVVAQRPNTLGQWVLNVLGVCAWLALYLGLLAFTARGGS